MGDEDDGVALFVQVLEHPQHFAAGVAVQSTGGFVGQNDRRVPGQRIEMKAERAVFALILPK